MDAFEHIISSILERKGFWTRTSFKVELTKSEKVAIGRYSSPRWELDVVAYKASTNQLYAVECKSYLDSFGVRLSGLDGSSEIHARYYKLFNESKLREVVLHRLVLQLIDQGMCRNDPEVKLCLAAGKIYKQRDEILTFFAKRGWLLWDAEWLRQELTEIARSGYENSIEAVVTKILLRNSKEPVVSEQEIKIK